MVVGRKPAAKHGGDVRIGDVVDVGAASGQLGDQTCVHVVADDCEPLAGGRACEGQTHVTQTHDRQVDTWGNGHGWTSLLSSAIFWLW